MAPQTAAEYLESGFTKSVLIASHRKVPGGERRDLLQEAAVALLQVPGRFDTCQWEERASRAMRTTARRAYRVASVEVPFESGGVLNTPGSANNAEAIQLAQRAVIKAATAALDPKQRQLVRLLYDRELLSVEAAGRLRLSPSQITKIHQAALRVMRDTLAEHGITSLKQIEENACF